MVNADVQQGSLGDASEQVHAAAVSAARPLPGLRWLDIGCGKGHVLRRIRDQHQPTQLTGVDIIDWLDDELRDRVEIKVGAAEERLPEIEAADRVLLVEVMEHLEAPWTVLRAAAKRVKLGGVIVVTTPNVATLRHRSELAVRGELTFFRPDNLPHLQPILPHVTERILREEGLTPQPRRYAVADVVSLTGGRAWPQWVSRRFPRLLCVSVILSARRSG